MEQTHTGGGNLRAPAAKFNRVLIVLLCLAWSGFQLYIAYQPVNAMLARIGHLAFALGLAFWAYPGAPPRWWRRFMARLPFKFGNSHTTVPWYDWGLALSAVAAALYLWWDYDNIVYRAGLPTVADVAFGIILILCLLDAARRTLGWVLPILAILFLAYCFAGPYLPDFIRHRGIPLEYVINDMYLADTGIFGVPLGVSTSFVFLFVLFGALLEQAGAGKYFIDVAFSALGHFRGGPAKAAVVASGMTGFVSGSSIANTVTTGTFTIPLMKKTGLPAHKAAAVEVAASTNSQLMPPVMGAAAFIMAEILGMPYMDVVRAALIPALVSYLTLFYVVHLESLKLDLKPLPRASLPPFFKTVLRGLHYLVPLIVMLVYLVILRRSAITSVLLAIEALLIIMLIQRPVLAFLAHAPNSAQSSSLHKVLLRAFWTGMTDIFQGLVNGARNMIPVGIATATAGIIVGTVTITGLISRFVSVIETLAFGNIYLVLILTALTSMILGMGLPTTANYIVMATLTAPVIAQLSGAAGLVLPLLAVHLFVFYFGILADDTPPVGLAAYAAAAIGKADPIKTGVQGFVYDLRTALLPFVFLFNLELLTIAGVDANGNIIWLNDIFRVIYVFVFSTLGMFIVAAALQGYFMRFCQPAERILLLIAGLLILQPKLLSMLNLPLEFIRITCVCVCIGLYVWQRRHPKHDKM